MPLLDIIIHNIYLKFYFLECNRSLISELKFKEAAQKFFKYLLLGLKKNIY